MKKEASVIRIGKKPERNRRASTECEERTRTKAAFVNVTSKQNPLKRSVGRAGRKRITLGGVGFNLRKSPTNGTGHCEGLSSFWTRCISDGRKWTAQNKMRIYVTWKSGRWWFARECRRGQASFKQRKGQITTVNTQDWHREGACPRVVRWGKKAFKRSKVFPGRKLAALSRGPCR